MGILEIIELIGAVASAIMAIVGFIVFISKKPTEWFKSLIRKEAEAANDTLEEQMGTVLKRLDKNDEATLAMLRNEITEIYYLYRDSRKIPLHVKEDVFSLYE